MFPSIKFKNYCYGLWEKEFSSITKNIFNEPDDNCNKDEGQIENYKKLCH